MSSPPPDPFEFLKKLWGPMGLPLAGLSGTTQAIGEVDRRIAELRSVETWLNINLSVLRMTIQGLEMQKAGLAAMQSAAGGGSPASAAPSDPSQRPPDGDVPPRK